MAKKPAVPPQPPPPPAPARRSFSPLLALALGVGVVTIAIIGYSRSGQTEPDGAAVASQSAGQPPAVASSAVENTAPPENARFGPHKQDVLPTLPFGGGPPARPADVVRAVYKFSAEHPEVLGYVPCYCGCERSGHRGNDDCFVSARAANGDVVRWEPHGIT